jgi:hypothetical protein
VVDGPTWWYPDAIMVRTQIQLTEAQHAELKRWAQELGISLAEAVRRCVAERLEAERSHPDRGLLVKEARAVYGRYADPEGESRVALDHDEHLSETFRR